MSKKLKLTSIRLETKDGQVIDLSLDDAKQLHSQLEDLFGKRIEYVPGQPVIIERDYWPHPHPMWPQIWCGDSTGDPPTLGHFGVTCVVDGYEE